MGQLQKRAEQDAKPPATISKKQALYTLVEQNPNIAKTLPKQMDIERFKRMLLVAANQDEKLLECSPASFIQAGVTCAILGLEPNDPRGLAYLLPYRDKDKGMVVNLIIGYQGMIELATRSGKVNTVHAAVVYKTDEFAFSLGTAGESIVHVPDLDGGEADSDITHAYAWARVNGELQAAVVTRKRIEKARAQSRGADSSYSPWVKWFPEMAAKTAIRVLSKRLPQSPELAAIVAAEDAGEPVNIGTITHDASPHFVEDFESAIDVAATDATDEKAAVGTGGTATPDDSPTAADQDDDGRPF